MSASNTVDERTLEVIAEHLRSGRISIAASMLSENAPQPQKVGSALARLSRMAEVSQESIQLLLGKLSKYGIDVRSSEKRAVPSGPPMVDMPSGWRDLKTLGYITAVANLKSIERFGILGYNRAQRVTHVSIADPEVQRRRHRREVQAKDLHDFVNLYINPRNAMLSQVISKRGAGNIAVVGVSAPKVFALPGVIVTERNAAAKTNVVSWPGVKGLQYLDRLAVFADSWYPNGNLDHDLRQLMMAEVLVPDSVPSAMIEGATVVHSETARRIKSGGISLPIASDQHLFFA